MPISFRCPKCRECLTVEDAYAGQKTSCISCGQRLQVPAPPPPPPPLPNAGNKTVLGELEPVAQAKDWRAQAPPVRPAAPAAEPPPFIEVEEVEVEPAGPKKYCQECGAHIRAKAAICPKCGVRQPDLGFSDAPAGPSRDGIKIPVLISAISNAVHATVWALTCVGLVLSVPAIVLCVFEFLFWSSVDRMPRAVASSKAKTLGICEIVIGFLCLNIPTFVCGIVILVNAGKLGEEYAE